jgi:DNA-binding MarR family transcriptional regulator
MPDPPIRQPAPADAVTADRLHSAAIRLLRRLRLLDDTSGLSAPRLSALSVIVFRGPLTLTALAAAEQVRPPTITRLVQELERGGLVERLADPVDRRVTRVRATAEGKRLLDAGRRARVEFLARALARLPRRDRTLLGKAADVLGRLVYPEREPPPR